jgi:hypothetical protein
MLLYLQEQRPSLESSVSSQNKKKNVLLQIVPSGMHSHRRDLLLISQLLRFLGRFVEGDSVDTICQYCGCGSVSLLGVSKLYRYSVSSGQYM